MASIDSIPIVSQIKSLVQSIAGDNKGAKKTQINFTNQCIIVSQSKSLVQAISGDKKGAEKTQLKFLKGVSNFADGLPVVGHVKGGIHYAMGDKEKGDNSMKAASRTVGVVAGGVGGFLTAGPVGSVVGGIAAGAAMDRIITTVDSSVHGEERPYGIVASIQTVKEGNSDAGHMFDTVAGVAFDGLTGYGAGKVTKMAQAMSSKALSTTASKGNAVNGAQAGATFEATPKVVGAASILDFEHGNLAATGEIAHTFVRNITQVKKPKVKTRQNFGDCAICFDNDATVVLIPCGHLGFCDSCAKPLQCCPICRQSIEGKFKTHKV